MEKNIFKDAYFGKPYKTRDGRKALYLDSFYRLFNGKVVLTVEGSSDNLLYVYPDGWIDPINGICDRKESSLDIVSVWDEEINEEEYEKKIKSLINSCIYWEAYESEPELFAKSLKELLDFAPKDKRTIDYCADLIKSRKTILEEVNNNIKSIISKEINEKELETLVS